MIITGQMIGLWKSFQLNTTNPDTKAAGDTAPTPHLVLQERFLTWNTGTEALK